MQPTGRSRTSWEPDMGSHTCDSSSWEAEEGELQVGGLQSYLESLRLGCVSKTPKCQPNNVLGLRAEGVSRRLALPSTDLGSTICHSPPFHPWPPTWIPGSGHPWVQVSHLIALLGAGYYGAQLVPSASFYKIYSIYL